MSNSPHTEMSFEQYAAWATSRYPGYHAQDEMSPTEDAVYAATEAPASSDACPVTVRSNRHGVVVTPRPKRSV